jgi:DNA-directed RNA polymerase beta' subunit
MEVDTLMSSLWKDFSATQSKSRNGDIKDINKVRAISICLASPEMIREWSYGEVKNPETIDYKTHKPKPDGLFCERVFGPTRDYECACGKYRGIKHKGVTCDRCGVELIQSKSRRSRLGHIDLEMPVAHIWFSKGVPSRMANLLDVSPKDLERVLYYEEYIVLDPGDEKDNPLGFLEVITERQYQEMQDEFGKTFRVGMGAEAIYEALQGLDLDALADKMRTIIKETRSKQKAKKAIKRLKIIEDFRNSSNRPEWMILTVLPVIPPDLRPLVPLDGGRFATSDLNDLYRRVINRNNRLRRLKEVKAPEVIIRNEKRMLQEAVDALLDNGRRGRPVKGSNNRPLKSLADMLKGKQGRFRQNLLGKRVDYSGRSVIVVGPELKFHQCGLPKKMALELFEPFIIRKLEELEDVNTIRSAKRKIERGDPEVFDVLEEVIKDHPVLLNRAPTLHRLGIQAFEPVLVEGNAIRLHPLVCSAYNADFDGDQMAVHVPLSREAQIESRVIMLSSNNILLPSDGSPVASPTQDIVLGCYYLTKMVLGGVKREEDKTVRLRTFANLGEVIRAYDANVIGLHDEVLMRMNGQRISTSAGRVIFNEVVPEELGYVNVTMSKKELSKLISRTYVSCGAHRTVALLDDLKELGFYYAKKSGLSFGLHDLCVPENKDEVLSSASGEVEQINEQYSEGVITDTERYNKVIDRWIQASDRVAKDMMKTLSRDKGGFNPIYVMTHSEARKSTQQVRQLAGMRGLMSKPMQKLTGGVGEVIETPITSNFKEGLTVLEYFISTHGARKGLADTALKTAEAGYLTRRLVDVAQDVIINEDDCGTIQGIEVSAIREGDQMIESLPDRILGRTALEDILHPLTGEVLVAGGEEIDEKCADMIERSGIDRVRIRSVMACESRRGVCVRCYGRDLARGKTVEIGEAVGVIAAQSIGEPGTQLTLRTFHIGGTTSRIVEQSEAQVTGLAPGEHGVVYFLNLNAGQSDEGRSVAITGDCRPVIVKLANRKVTNLKEKETGTVSLEGLKTSKSKQGVLTVSGKGGSASILNSRGKEVQVLEDIPGGATLRVKDGDKVKLGDIVAEWEEEDQFVVSEHDGKVRFVDIENGVTLQRHLDEETGQIQSVVVEHPTKKPRMQIEGRDGNVVAEYNLPVGFHLRAANGEEVFMGKVLASTDLLVQEMEALPVGAEIFCADRSQVKQGDVLAKWDPYFTPIICQRDGTVKFEQIKDGLTVREHYVKESSEPQLMVMEHKEDLHPALLVKASDDRPGRLEYPLPRGAHITLRDGQKVQRGTILAKIPVESFRSRDVTGGLPRVEEIFEARRPKAKDLAIVAKVNGWVRIPKVGAGDPDYEKAVAKFSLKRKRGSRFILIRDKDGEFLDAYRVEVGKHIIVNDGDYVQAGEKLLDGSIDPHEFLQVMGEKRTQEYLLNEVQEVYRLQGVSINDKHIEIIIRQMMKKVTITMPGETLFLPDDEVDRFDVMDENARVVKEKGKPAKFLPKLLGITKASLGTQSFISAASFQETTRVLTQAAISGRIDNLLGLKENVIVGHLVPAGTGKPVYRNMLVDFAQKEEEEGAASGAEVA